MTVRSLGSPSRRPVRPPLRRPARRPQPATRPAGIDRTGTTDGDDRGPGDRQHVPAATCRGRRRAPKSCGSTVAATITTAVGLRLRCRRRRLPAGRRVPLRVHRAGRVPVLLHDPRHSRDRHDRHRRRHGHGLTAVAPRVRTRELPRPAPSSPSSESCAALGTAVGRGVRLARNDSRPGDGGTTIEVPADHADDPGRRRRRRRRRPHPRLARRVQRGRQRHDAGT